MPPSEQLPFGKGAKGRNKRVSSFRHDYTEWGWRYPDKREICDTNTVAGRREYDRRKRVMWERQKRRCGLCEDRHFMALHEVTFEHEAGRGMGAARRDDRIEKDGKPYNLAACGLSNTQKGSKRL